MKKSHWVSAPMAACLLLAVGCEREDRRLNSQQPAAPTQLTVQGPLQPGPTLIADTTEGPYDDNAPGTSEGQVLFEQMNCSGCHSNGGGGMGPVGSGAIDRRDCRTDVPLSG